LHHLPLFERCVPPTSPPCTHAQQCAPARLCRARNTHIQHPHSGVVHSHASLGTRSAPLRPTAPHCGPLRQHSFRPHCRPLLPRASLGLIPPAPTAHLRMNPAGTSPARLLPDIRLSPVPTHPFACPVCQSLAHIPQHAQLHCAHSPSPLRALLTSMGVAYSPCSPHAHKTACAVYTRGAPHSVPRIPTWHLRRHSARLSCPHTFHAPRSERPLRTVRSLRPQPLALHRTRSLALPTHTPPLTSPPRCPLAPFPHIASTHLARISCSRVGLESRREDVARQWWEIERGY
jgi:hypothetical protein